MSLGKIIYNRISFQLNTTFLSSKFYYLLLCDVVCSGSLSNFLKCLLSYLYPILLTHSTVFTQNFANPRTKLPQSSQ